MASLPPRRHVQIAVTVTSLAVALALAVSFSPWPRAWTWSTPLMFLQVLTYGWALVRLALLQRTLGQRWSLTHNRGRQMSPQEVQRLYA